MVPCWKTFLLFARLRSILHLKYVTRLGTRGKPMPSFARMRRRSACPKRQTNTSRGAHDGFTYARLRLKITLRSKSRSGGNASTAGLAGRGCVRLFQARRRWQSTRVCPPARRKDKLTAYLLESRTKVTLLRNSFAVHQCSPYFFNELAVKNCTVTLRLLAMIEHCPLGRSLPPGYRGALVRWIACRDALLPIIADILRVTVHF